MPRYVSPSRSRTPSPSRNSSSRPYTDGVYTPSTTASDYSRSPSPSRSRHTSRSRSRSRYTSRSRSRSRSTVRSRRERLSSILDTSASTPREKASSAAAASLVMLGAIGVAAVAAHKLWPNGGKEDWEGEGEGEEKKKKKKPKVEDASRERRQRRGREGAKDHDDDDDDDDDASRQRRLRYLQDRRRDRLALPRAAGAAGTAAFWEERERRREESRSRDRCLDDNYAPGTTRRYSADADTRMRREMVDHGEDYAKAYYHYGDRRGETAVMVPSVNSEREYVVRRDAPPGQRLRPRERDGGYYR